MSWSLPPADAKPADHLKLVMVMLCDSIVTQGRAANMAMGFLILIWQRFDKLSRRIAAILARGPIQPRPAPPDPVTPKPRQPSRRTYTPKPPADYGMPRGFAWLMKRLPGNYQGIAVSHTALAILLIDPDLIPLLETHPDLIPILRQLCRALGVERPPFLDRPKPAQPPKPRISRAIPHSVRYPKFPPPGSILHPPPPVAPGSRFWPPWVKIRKITL